MKRDPFSRRRQPDRPFGKARSGFGRKRPVRSARKGFPVGLMLVGLAVGAAVAGGFLQREWLAAEVRSGIAALRAPAPNRGDAESEPGVASFGCFDPHVVDGDTVRCGSIRIRLASIDAPELPGHCRPGRRCTPGDPYASTAHMRELVRFRTIRCREVDRDRYGRSVAFCSVDGQDLSCAQVGGGFAVQRYGVLSCAGQPSGN